MCVSIRAFVSDFGMSAGIPAAILLSRERNISPANASYPNSALMLMISTSSFS
jgi:hypothetical protein